ncbi:hypothetical protein BY458DRAFT_446003 [Sporodiniella umbellata]|nr:hypothetical protein BY458DRAFT_446003 [Sporodiniella umbellata]
MKKVFTDSFWSKNKSGMIQLLDYIKSTHDDLDIIYSIYKKRAGLENEFGEKLLALSTAQELDEPAEKGVAGAYQAIAMELKKTAESHLDLAKKLRKDISEELETKLEDYRTLFDKWEKTLHQVYDERQEKTVELLKIRALYLKEHDALKGQSNGHTKKLKEQYKAMVTEVDQLSQEWVESWTEACETMQAMEEDRVEFIKCNVWEYANLVSARLLIQDEWCEVIRSQLEQCSAEEEIERCISSYGTGSKVPTTNEYVGEVMKEIKKKQLEEKRMEETPRYNVSDNTNSTASRTQIKRKPLSRSLMGRGNEGPVDTTSSRDANKSKEQESKSLEAILSLQEVQINNQKDFHRRQPSEYKPDTGSLPTRRTKTTKDVSNAPKSPRPTVQTLPENRTLSKNSNFAQPPLQTYNPHPQYEQRSPMIQPHHSPMIGSQRSPMMQPQRSPMMNPQHSPMVQPMMMQAPISPLMHPQRSPSMAHQVPPQSYSNAIPPPIAIPNYMAPSPQPSPSVIYGASPAAHWPTAFIDGRPIISWARSKYDYSPTDPTEIPLTKNCLVGALESDLSQESWWTGAVWDEYYQTWSQAGSVPGNFMVKLQ